MLAVGDRIPLEAAVWLGPNEQVAAPFTFRNMKGQTLTVPLWAALRHVVNHASYHRGQVASKLKRLGVEPPITDLVFWVAEQTPRPA